MLSSISPLKSPDKTQISGSIKSLSALVSSFKTITVENKQIIKNDLLQIIDYKNCDKELSNKQIELICVADKIPETMP